MQQRILASLALLMLGHTLNLPAAAGPRAPRGGLELRSPEAVRQSAPPPPEALPNDGIVHVEFRSKTPGRQFDVLTQSGAQIAQCEGACTLELKSNTYYMLVIPATEGRARGTSWFRANENSNVEVKDASRGLALAGGIVAIASAGMTVTTLFVMGIAGGIGCLDSCGGSNSQLEYILLGSGLLAGSGLAVFAYYSSPSLDLTASSQGVSRAPNSFPVLGWQLHF